MLHTLPRLLPESMRLIPDQRDNHAVKVEEEHQEMEPELDERFLFMDVEFAEDFGCVEEMLVIEDSVDTRLISVLKREGCL